MKFIILTFIDGQKVFCVQHQAFKAESKRIFNYYQILRGFSFIANGDKAKKL